MDKFIAILLAAGGLALLIIGIVHKWVPHMLFGIGAIAAAMAIGVCIMARDAPSYDEKNNRLYRYVTRNSGSPWGAPCPKCKEHSRVIYSLSNKQHHGVYCKKHAEVWFDLLKKEE